MQHIVETQRLLEQVFTHHQKVVCWYSGGKDSTTLMHLMRPWSKQVTVLSVIMDNAFPGVQKQVETTCEMWGFSDLQILAPPISFEQYVANYGWPSQLIHTSMDGPLLDPFYDGGPRLASWWHCSVLRVIWPLMQASQECQADAVLTAARKSDAPAHGRIGPVIEAHDIGIAGWTRYDVLHPWSTKQLWAYIDTHQLPLPPLYASKRYATWEFSDCLNCPLNSQQVSWLKEHEPRVFDVMWKGFKPALEKMLALANNELRQWDIQALDA